MSEFQNAVKKKIVIKDIFKNGSIITAASKDGNIVTVGVLLVGWLLV
jgi:hypothetical protein